MLITMGKACQYQLQRLAKASSSATVVLQIWAMQVARSALRETNQNGRTLIAENTMVPLVLTSFADLTEPWHDPTRTLGSTVTDAEAGAAAVQPQQHLCTICCLCYPASALAP
jgi:hypothetical protein